VSDDQSVQKRTAVHSFQVSEKLVGGSLYLRGDDRRRKDAILVLVAKELDVM
jgi:hypothetical protein